MKYIFEYIWLGGNQELRSKTRVLDFSSDSDFLPFNTLPHWNYDGSSTKQAIGSDSEVMIYPVAGYNDPFRGEQCYLVFCDTYTPDGTPLSNNHRTWAASLFNTCTEEEPWYGIEQEYFLINPRTGRPLGFPPGNSFPNPQGQYYCSVGCDNAFGREIASEHLRLCLRAGLTMSGMNAEVAPGQWEYQVGPCVGIDAGDEVWVSRYILERVAEKYGVSVCLEPKPIKGDWNGSGCHTNYSTRSMREGYGDKNGLHFIETAIEALSTKHVEHMKVYGSGNEERMTGEHETAHFDVFSCGRANRGASVRIGNDTIKDKQGYFEDRRPSSNMDPYLVTGILFKTTVLDAMNIVTNINSVISNDELIEESSNDSCEATHGSVYDDVVEYEPQPGDSVSF